MLKPPGQEAEDGSRYILYIHGRREGGFLTCLCEGTYFGLSLFGDCLLDQARRLHLIPSPGCMNLLPLPTGRHSGHVHPTPKDLPEQISLSSRLSPLSTRAAT
jgi:hypothetical protein